MQHRIRLAHRCRLTNFNALHFIMKQRKYFFNRISLFIQIFRNKTRDPKFTGNTEQKYKTVSRCFTEYRKAAKQILLKIYLSKKRTRSGFCFSNHAIFS